MTKSLRAYGALFSATGLLAAIGIGFFSWVSVSADEYRSLCVDTAAVVLTRTSMPFDDHKGPFVIMTMWKDGSGIVSADMVGGGRPYYAFTVEERRVESFLAGIAADGLFGKDVCSISRGGYGAHMNRILVRYNGRTLDWQSWHELQSIPGSRVVTSEGVLNFKNGQNWIAQSSVSSQDYLSFIVKWHQIRQSICHLCLGAMPIDGAFEWQDNRIVWVGKPIKR